MSGVLRLAGGRKPSLAPCAWCVRGVCVPCCVLLVFSCCVSGVGQGPVQRRAVLFVRCSFHTGPEYFGGGSGRAPRLREPLVVVPIGLPFFFPQSRHVSINPRSPLLSGRAAGAATLLVGGWASVHDTRTVVCSRSQPVVHPHRCMAFRQEFQCSACALDSTVA